MSDGRNEFLNSIDCRTNLTNLKEKWKGEQ